MYKWFLVALLTIIVVIVLLFYVLGLRSRTGNAAGLVEGQLAACPNTPNCVSSEAGTDDTHSIDALGYVAPRTSEQAWKHLQLLIKNGGGIIQKVGPQYLAASYRSAVFGFVDDLEARLDDSHYRIQLRSASRVGRSDFGANRARVEAIRQQY